MRLPLSWRSAALRSGPPGPVRRNALMLLDSRGNAITAHTISRRLLTAAAASVVVLGMAGCALAPAPTVTATVTVTPKPPKPTPTPTPTPTATPTPPPAAAEEPELVPNPPLGETVPNAPAPTYPPGPAEDLGETPGARGTTTSGPDGALLTYTVVEGDSFFDIAQRFNVPVQQLLHMNPSVPGLGEKIYIKQVINLDWTTKR